MLDGLRAAGAPPEVMELKRAELLRCNEAVELDIWPENARAAELFYAMSTQWVMVSVGMGGLMYQGLRYDVLDAVEKRLPPDPADPDTPDARTLFYQLHTMEQEALKHLNEKH